jgi:F420-non-reducing hydrogenase large subunit
VSIDPLTRLEGHGRIDLFLDDAGAVEQAYLVIPELRGFEKFLEGRPIEEMPQITSRICGVCPEAHHAAAAKAADAVYSAQIPEAAELIRRLQYNAFIAGDHATHFFALGGPDFIVGPTAPREQRTIIGVLEKLGTEVAGRVIRMRKEAHEVSTLLGGRAIHPVGMMPGGQSQPVSPETAARLREIGAFMVEFAAEAIGTLDRFVINDKNLSRMLALECYTSRTSYLALVNEHNQPDPYDGHIRVVGPDGAEIVRYHPSDYLEHVAERVEPWSYLKFPYFKKLGWHGISEETAGALVRSGPLGSLNAADSMQTPRAQAEFERFRAYFGATPVHRTLSYHWARLIELLQAAELVVRYAADERLTSPDVRTLPTGTPREGVGTVEAPRGLLTHHYITDENGIVQRANLIVGTTYNYPAIQLSVLKAARDLVRPGYELTEPIMNGIEMAFRAYDPCFGCATHALPGAGPMELRAFSPDGTLADGVRRLADGSLEHLRPARCGAASPAAPSGAAPSASVPRAARGEAGR